MNAEKKTWINYHFLDVRPSGEEARKIREDAGLSRVEYAAMLRVSIGTVIGWESGRTQMPAPIWYLLNKVGMEEVIRENRENCGVVKAALQRQGI
jgi:DNA-binding transcriptional regulator YiaG